MIDREEYTGQCEDYFGGTTLHLSFTDWSIPIDVGESERGHHDTAAYIMVFGYRAGLHVSKRWQCGVQARILSLSRVVERLVALFSFLPMVGRVDGNGQFALEAGFDLQFNDYYLPAF
jgi:hypothetical protein